jgi:predicted SAM-dependent methyltransferase/cephalosporin hydroxylase
MRLFQRKAVSSQNPYLAPAPVFITEKEAMARAVEARAKGDWAEALMALEGVADRKGGSEAFRELRSWALGQAGRKGSKTAWAKVNVGESRLEMVPEHVVALSLLVRQVRPRMILELGSRGGGVARWLLDICNGLDLDTVIHSADWGQAGRSKAARLQFWRGDLRKPSGIWPGGVLKTEGRPLLILIRTGAGHGLTWSALRSLHKYLQAGDVICVESEADPVPSPDSDPESKQNAAHALVRFVAAHPVEYEVVPEFEAAFGYGAPVMTRLRVARHTGLDPLEVSVAPGLDSALEAMRKGEWQEGLAILNPLKAERNARRGVDYLRALCFLGQEASIGACEAAKEELRFFPDHRQASALFESLMRRLFPSPPRLGNVEFHELHRAVRRYTMLSDERLYSLYLRTRLVCQMDIPGDLVECGVAAGGGSAMIAATMARHSRRARKLYSCDTFEGMPAPTVEDVAYGVAAEESGWGSGTCAAPEGSLLEICNKLGVADRVVPVKGFFKDTLRNLKNQLPDGIAFLHMDGDWYESTRDILVSLYDKVQMKGFIQIDDFGHWEGCRRAIWDFAKERGFEAPVHAIDGTGVWMQRPDRVASEMMLLNLGCGGHFHRDWVNLDIAPAAKEVIQHDLAHEPLPFENGSCSAVYHSHVLEHIPPVQVSGFLSECHRVLDAGGVLRVVVPDLEGIARQYLKQLDAGDTVRHEWMTIELVDQLARHWSGGQMMAYWKQNPMPAEEFVIERLGREVKDFIEAQRSNEVGESQEVKALSAEKVGAFRLGGEVHQWMYDRLSLGRLLAEAGFEGIEVKSAVNSDIVGFAGYELDADEAGRVRKPDSLFMEARKPGGRA